MLCQNCKKKPTCIELCERVEKYVNYNYVSQRESTHLEWMLDLLSVHVKAIHHNEIKTYFTSEGVNFPFLSDFQNRCLHLFYFEGLEYNQIAMRVRKSKTVVKGQLQRGKNKIRSTCVENKETI